MGKIYNNIEELIGNTPLVRMQKGGSDRCAHILLKLESFNPFHSVKDRIGLSMIESAEREGTITPGTTILVEATSGNTGIGLAFVAANRGYEIIFTMPDTMSKERRKLLKALGAKLILTDGAKGMKGAIEKAEEVAEGIPGSWIPRQFDNPANPKIHYETTGPEIWDDTDGEVDVLVSGVGTGGTITGAGRFLREKNPKVSIVAVEPEDSPVLSGGAPGPHKIQGIGAGFIPSILDTSLIDDIYKASLDESVKVSRSLAREEGIFVGISSGAIVSAAIEIAKRPANKGKTIVAVVPDFGERYFTSVLFSDISE